MNQVLFRCTITGRVAIKKNGRKFRSRGPFGGGFTVASDRYKDWAEKASVQIRQAMRGMRTITEPVNVRMIFYFLDRRNEADLSNLYQGPEDLLQEMGVLKNDKLIYSHDGSRKRFGFKPRVEIEITPFADLDLKTSG